MNMQNLILAKKYARAFIALYADQLTWNELEKIKKFNIYLKEHKETLFYAQLSALDNHMVEKTFKTLLSDFELIYATNNLVALLIQHKRLFLVSNILDYIIKLMKERLNIMEFVIESAAELDNGQRDYIINFLSRSTKKTIVYTTKINRCLIAGVRAYSDTVGWEFSVRKQLEVLSRVS